MSIVHNTTRITEAIARLPQQHQDKTKLVAFLSALVAQAQALEDAQWQLFTERTVDTAIGVQLDALGSLVGQPRNNAADEDYRRFIRAKISVNKSRGLIEDILTVTRLTLDLGIGDGSLLLQNYGIAGVRLVVGSVIVSGEVADFLAEFLKNVAAAGVRLVSETAGYVSTALFQLDGGDNTGLGLGTVTDGTVGGRLTRARGT